jgi:hypothetical protein
MLKYIPITLSPSYLAYLFILGAINFSVPNLLISLFQYQIVKLPLLINLPISIIFPSHLSPIVYLITIPLSWKPIIIVGYFLDSSRLLIFSIYVLFVMICLITCVFIIKGLVSSPHYYLLESVYLSILSCLLLPILLSILFIHILIS